MSCRHHAPPDPDADLLKDNDDELFEEVDQGASSSRNPHASATRWRHEESSAYAKHAAGQHHHHGLHHHGAHPVARDAEARSRVNDLADFLNSSRISPDGQQRTKTSDGSQPPGTPRFKPIMAVAADARDAVGAVSNGDRPLTGTSKQAAPPPPPDGKEIAVGPLINYRRMEDNHWIGSVLVVTKGGGKTQPSVPTLHLRKAGAEQGTAAQGVCLYSDPRNTFWRFDVAVQLEHSEAQWEYALPDLRFASKTKPRVNSFFVPAASESMRIMFHSCNGFSIGTDEDAWSGPALWNDVMRRHREVPFHVMIGGGDQIYNDGIRVSGPLREWTRIGNPKKRQHYPFPEALRQDCDDYYLHNYIRWYGTEPFASANGQIPQLNIWDDHDIIDGFGSYVNDFMKCDVFRGIGGVAHKYYMLFQHHLPPPPSTYTSDAIPAASVEEGQGVDPNQMVNTYVHPRMTESNYIVGSKPGPYVQEHSHNMFARLGARMCFLGIDARTERTRHQVNYRETYNQIFDRLRQELGSARSSGNPYRHMILLLGIPIAYPRLTWLENIFSSPLMGPIKFMNRRLGLGGNFFNHFDGSVDLLDDLDDHYTARTHKKERNLLVLRLQEICAEFSVRITILGGDVHLAALGRFYSNLKLNVPVEQDYRYMVNVVSSAIVNKPPPTAIANLLARRNKIHHLNAETDETLLELFDQDPGEGIRTGSYNRVTMPSRNFSMITENSPNNPPPHLNGLGGGGDGDGPPGSSASSGRKVPGRDGHSPIHAGEANCGTKHRAANPREHGQGTDGSLDVCIRVEINQHDKEGKTRLYGLSIPALSYNGPKPPPPPPSLAAPPSSSSAGSRSEHSLPPTLPRGE